MDKVLFAYKNMIIKILSYAAGLKDILSTKLKEIGLRAETVDYSKALLPQLRDADVIVNGLGTVDKSIIDAVSKLKLVHQVGTGIDNVNVDYCTSKSIFVANVPNMNNVAVAEYTICLMIYLAKNIKSAGSSLMKRRVINWSSKACIYHYFLEYNYCCMIENSELLANS